MQSYWQMKKALGIGVVLASALFGQGLPGQTDVKPGEAKGLAPRARAADYQASGQAGAVTIAAEYTGHAVATAGATLSTEDYVAVELALYGKPEARVRV